MKEDHPAYAAAEQFVDMGFLARRYTVAHKTVQRWVEYYTGVKQCPVEGHHDRPHGGCNFCATAIVPQAPQAQAVRNGAAPLWRSSQIPDWDAWVRMYMERFAVQGFKRDEGLSVPD